MTRAILTIAKPGARSDFREWASEMETEEAWFASPNGSWLLSGAALAGVPHKTLVSTALACTSVVVQLLPKEDPIPTLALAAVDLWLSDKISAADVAAATARVSRMVAVADKRIDTVNEALMSLVRPFNEEPAVGDFRWSVAHIGNAANSVTWCHNYTLESIEACGQTVSGEHLAARCGFAVERAAYAVMSAEDVERARLDTARRPSMSMRAGHQQQKMANLVRTFIPWSVVKSAIDQAEALESLKAITGSETAA